MKKITDIRNIFQSESREETSPLKHVFATHEGEEKTEVDKIYTHLPMCGIMVAYFVHCKALQLANCTFNTDRVKIIEVTSSVVQIFHLQHN